MHGTVNAPSVRRTFSAAFLNSVANDPAVRPWLAGAGPIDMRPIIESPANFALQTEAGGFVLHAQEPGVYEVHSLFLPGHGSHPVRAMRAAMNWMFTRTDCLVIVSKVPSANKAAKGLAIAGGLRPLFKREDAALGPCEYVELDAMRWAMANAALEAEGEAFHQALAEAKRASGSALPVHAHDEAHERAVGAAYLMIRRGQAIKGVAFYNRWARLAGYAEAGLISLSPVTVDIGDAVVALNETELEVVVCR